MRHKIRIHLDTETPIRLKFSGNGKEYVTLRLETFRVTESGVHWAVRADRARSLLGFVEGNLSGPVPMPGDSESWITLAVPITAHYSKGGSVIAPDFIVNVPGAVILDL